ncbi:cytochrome P450 [Xylariaceae sp. FL0255]|nr:cytochrome P450 [Xylariaceae sp. FL0255]
MPQIEVWTMIQHALVLGFLVVVLKVIYSLYFHPLAKFPGPRLAAISRLPFSIMSVKGTTYSWLDSLHEKYGTTVRISPGELSTISPGAWKDIYLTRPQLRKDPSSQTPPMKGADSLFTAHGEDHSRIRRIYTSAFTEKALKEQSTIIESHVDLLIERLRREATKTKDGVLDLAKGYGYAALDIIADLAFGESFHGLEGDNEHNWIVGIFMGAKFGAIRNSLSHFYPLDRLFGLIFLRLTAKARARNYELTENALEKRTKLKEAGISRPDFLEFVVDHLNQEKGMTKNEMEVQSLAIVIAGCQLTTVALATMTYLLLENPRTYERLRKEIHENFNEEREINVSTTQLLPYLSAVVNETLRIHHPTPIHLPRIVPDEGMSIDGVWIPGKTVIGMSLQSAQTSPRYWEDPLGFHPERFLTPDHPWYDPRFEKDDKGAFRPFSIGNRNCLGGKVFLAEAKLIMARTIWAFDLEMPEGTNHNWMDQKAYLVFVPTPLKAKIALRSA